jgi:hypothetical protein
LYLINKGEINIAKTKNHKCKYVKIIPTRKICMYCGALEGPDDEEEDLYPVDFI